jgi:hypothetical protein
LYKRIVLKIKEADISEALTLSQGRHTIDIIRPRITRLTAVAERAVSPVPEEGEEEEEESDSRVLFRWPEEEGKSKGKGKKRE